MKTPLRFDFKVTSTYLNQIGCIQSNRAQKAFFKVLQEALKNCLWSDSSIMIGRWFSKKKNLPWKREFFSIEKWLDWFQGVSTRRQQSQDGSFSRTNSLQIEIFSYPTAGGKKWKMIPLNMVVPPRALLPRFIPFRPAKKGGMNGKKTSGKGFIVDLKGYSIWEREKNCTLLWHDKNTTMNELEISSRLSLNW